jgi:hypothetical protein
MPVPLPGRYSPPPDVAGPSFRPPRPVIHSPVSGPPLASDAGSESDEPPVQASRAAPRTLLAARLPKRSRVKHKPIEYDLPLDANQNNFVDFKCSLWFGMFIDGELRLSHKKHAVQYFTNRRYEYNDIWLTNCIKREYSRLKQKRAGRLSRWLWSLRTIGFASFKRVKSPDTTNACLHFEIC